MTRREKAKAGRAVVAVPPAENEIAVDLLEHFAQTAEAVAATKKKLAALIPLLL